MSKLPPIQYWLPVDESLALGAQPDPSGIHWLAEQGYTLIVNLNTPDAQNYWPDEGDQVLKAGLHYVHYPMNCTQLTPELYATLREILMDHRDGKIFMHCAMNVKSSGMAHIWRVEELGHDPIKSRADLAATPGHDPKWEKFWREMGV